MFLALSFPPEASLTAEDPLRLSWDNNILRIHSERIPGSSIEIWYLEAFCRGASTHRNWNETVIPHKTSLREVDPRGNRLILDTRVDPSVHVVHMISAETDTVSFHLTLVNSGEEFVDIQWAQPCIRVGRFTGLGQTDYFRRCFLFTSQGRQTLDRLPRAKEALYRGGQVYVPAGVDPNDLNPRPHSRTTPVNGLIGCFSEDGTLLLATAWNRTQELFQGVITCIHSDFRIGGLAPGQTKEIFGKVYLMKNDPDALLTRYRMDFFEGSFASD